MLRTVKDKRPNVWEILINTFGLPWSHNNLLIITYMLNGCCMILVSLTELTKKSEVLFKPFEIIMSIVLLLLATMHNDKLAF